MAATKLIAMHQNKGRSVMQCLKDRTDYAMNGDKTEDGKYISSYQCNPELVDLEFAQAKKEYLHKTWRQPKGDVLAYQIRQSFKPGEITPEEANEVGYETGMRFTKGSMLLSWQRMWTGHIFIIISFSILPIWTVTGSFVTSGFRELLCRDSATLSVWSMDFPSFRK